MKEKKNVKKKQGAKRKKLKNPKFFTWVKGLHIDPSIGAGVDEAKARMLT
jgi:hypothetical protein